MVNSTFYDSLSLISLQTLSCYCFHFILVMTTSTPEKQDGLKVLSEAIEKIKSKITDLGGAFNIQMAVSQLFIF